MTVRRWAPHLTAVSARFAGMKRMKEHQCTPWINVTDALLENRFSYPALRKVRGKGQGKSTTVSCSRGTSPKPVLALHACFLVNNLSSFGLVKFPCSKMWASLSDIKRKTEGWKRLVLWTAYLIYPLPGFRSLTKWDTRGYQFRGSNCRNHSHQHCCHRHYDYHLAVILLELYTANQWKTKLFFAVASYLILIRHVRVADCV